MTAAVGPGDGWPATMIAATLSGGSPLTVGPDEGTYWVIRHISWNVVVDTGTTNVDLTLNWGSELGTPIINYGFPPVTDLYAPIALPYIVVRYPNVLYASAGQVGGDGYAGLTVCGDVYMGDSPLL